jgi:hypothetical protein
MSKISYIKATVFALALPLVTFAQQFGVTNRPTTSGAINNLGGLIDKIIGYLNSALVLLMAIAVVTFVYWIIQYYVKPNDERSAAHSYVLWSIIGFFVILSMWGLVNVVKNTFGFSDNKAPDAAQINGLFPGHI